jgi:hypothetical protein
MGRDLVINLKTAKASALSADNAADTDALNLRFVCGGHDI